MLKNIIISIFFILGVLLINSALSNQNVEEKDIINLVEKASNYIKSNGEAAIKYIGSPDTKYYLKNKSIYVFIYDENCILLAHPYKPTLVGRSYKGKPDVRGKKFRDQIVEKALKFGQGWTDYSYQKPKVEGIFTKKVFCKLVKYNNKKYIVCAGYYLK